MLRESSVVVVLLSVLCTLPSDAVEFLNLTSVRIAALLPKSNRFFPMRQMIPAAEVALDKLNQQLPVSLFLGYGNSQCSELYGMKEAISFFVRDQADVFFGPVCDYAAAPVVRQSFFWNIPVVSTGSFALDYFISRSTTYAVLTRAGPGNLQSLAESLVRMMRRNGWRKTKIIYQRKATSQVMPVFCHLVTENIHWRFVQNSIKIEYVRIEDIATDFDENLKKIAKEFAGWYNEIKKTRYLYI